VRGAGLLFPVRDYKALADIILSLVKDKELYDNISSACYKRSLQYSSDKMINGYEEVYYSLIKNN
jgi:glycosyltransferase involved in cell wall biosynthesis